jgi:hypothetical protein
MTLIQQLRRIERIDHLIRSLSTGTPPELARKLRVSESFLYLLIKMMKEELNAPISYSRKEQSYMYDRNVRFRWGFMNEEETQQAD